MKMLWGAVIILAGFMLPAAEEKLQEPLPERPPRPAPVTITTVSATKDPQVLLVRYEQAGQAREQTLNFTNDIADFRYCSWMNEGVAIAISTTNHQFYYGVAPLTGSPGSGSPFRMRGIVRIPAPDGQNELLGIANTGGDSIVVSAVRHRRDHPDPKANTYGPDRLTGWMYIDNCPAVGGPVIPFDLAEPTVSLPKRK